MIAIRRVETDAELEAWRQVRIAVVPGERTSSLEELRAAETPERLFLLAELDGELAGSSMADQSDIRDRGAVLPRVLPHARRRGVGTALLHESVAHLEAFGFSKVGTRTDDDSSRAFAEHFGFREVNRDVEQVRSVGDESEPRPPDGVAIVAISERPDLWPALYPTVATQAFADMAVESPLYVTDEVWEREWINWPEATFVALADGEPIGCAGLMRDDDRPDRAENTLTAVRRDWRDCGVASALKRKALAFAAATGVREVYTWTQRGNEDMRRLNERLGYEYRSVSVQLEASVPLPSSA